MLKGLENIVENEASDSAQYAKAPFSTRFFKDHVLQLREKAFL